jgi:hypothetical protein
MVNVSVLCQWVSHLILPMTVLSRGEKPLKGWWHEIFCTQFFASKLVPQAPYSYTKAVLNINSNSPRYSNLKLIPRCGPSWRIWSYNVPPPPGGSDPQPTAAFKETIFEECVYGRTILHKDYNMKVLFALAWRKMPILPTRGGHTGDRLQIRIFQRIQIYIRNGFRVWIRLGDMIWWKKQRQNILCLCPFKHAASVNFC